MSVCLSVRPSFRVEQLYTHWMDFHENLYLSIFPEYDKDIQFSLQSNKKRDIHFRSHVAQLLLELHMFQTNL